MSSNSNSSQEQSQNPYDRNAKYIAVLGSCGVGISTFIHRYVEMEHDVATSDGLLPHTKDITLYGIGSGRDQIVLIDTPGFDNDDVSDSERLEALASHLDTFNQAGVQLTGIIYLHDIRKTRVTAQDTRQLELLRQLTGQENFNCIWLVTNFWPDANYKPQRDVADKTYRRLSQHKAFRLMLQEGAHLAKHHNTRESVEDIVNEIAGTGRVLRLLILRELVEERKPLAETTAGKGLRMIWQTRRNRRGADINSQKYDEKELRDLGGLKDMRRRREKSRKIEVVTAMAAVAGGAGGLAAGAGSLTTAGVAIAAHHAALWAVPVTVAKVVAIGGATLLCNMM